MPARYRPMLLTPAEHPPEGEGWAHEPKLDGWRAIIEIEAGKVRVWSRSGKEWTDRLPELKALGGLGDVVLDGEVVALSADGRADFHLLSSRLNSRSSLEPAVSLYVFDVLAHGASELVDQPWSARRGQLVELDLEAVTAGVVRPTLWSDDAAAMHAATAAVGAEGTVSKQKDSAYRSGRSTRWLKSKHRLTAEYQVAGWRPSAPARPGGLIIADAGEPIGVASIALADDEREGIVELLRRYGRHHPTGAVTIPEDCLVATVTFTSRTPTHGLLREATVVAISPAQGQ